MTVTGSRGETRCSIMNYEFIFYLPFILISNRQQNFIFDYIWKHQHPALNPTHLLCDAALKTTHWSLGKWRWLTPMTFYNLNQHGGGIDFCAAVSVSKFFTVTTGADKFSPSQWCTTSYETAWAAQRSCDTASFSLFTHLTVYGAIKSCLEHVELGW